MKEKKLIIGIVIFAILAFISYAFIVPLISQSNVEVTPDSANSRLVNCNIIVKNPIGIPLVKDGDLIIENINCDNIYVKSCIGVFGFASDIGTLTLSGDGGQGTSEKLNINEGTSDNVRLSWCGSKLTQKVVVTLRDDKNNQLYSKDYAIT